MASQTHVWIHNENIRIHGGKAGAELKAGLPRTKSVKTGLTERKALRDLSNAKAPAVPGPSKAKGKSALKEKSGIGGLGAKKAAPKVSVLSDDQIAKCREWAKEGIEYAEFTGNDAQKLEKDEQEERVRKEVEMVMSAMRDWTAMSYNLGMPKVPEDTEDILKLELEEVEVRPPVYNSGNKFDKEVDIDDLLEPELDLFEFPDIPFELKLKEEYD